MRLSKDWLRPFTSRSRNRVVAVDDNPKTRLFECERHSRELALFILNSSLSSIHLAQWLLDEDERLLSEEFVGRKADSMYRFALTKLREVR